MTLYYELYQNTRLLWATMMIYQMIKQRQQVTMVIHTIILFNKEGSVIELHVETTCHYIKAVMMLHNNKQFNYVMCCV